MEVDQEIQLTVIKTVNEESSGSLQIAKIRSLKCQYFFKLFSLDLLQLLNIQIFFRTSSNYLCSSQIPSSK